MKKMKSAIGMFTYEFNNCARKLSLFILIITACSFNNMQKKQRIIFFGDSITQAGVQPTGFITKLTEKLKAKAMNDHYELIGAGISGNKVYDLYLRMDDDVIEKKPDVVVIWIGVNDVWHKRTHGTGTDADKFEIFYTAIIKKLQAAKIKAVLCTPAVIGEKTDLTNELDGDLNKFAAIVRNLAQKYNYPLVDLRKAFLDYNLSNNKKNLEAGILTADRVHLNETGNQVVADEIMKVLVK